MNLQLPQTAQKFSTSWKTEIFKKESGLKEWSSLVVKLIDITFFSLSLSLPPSMIVVCAVCKS
jgi:hypothetical protein